MQEELSKIGIERPTYSQQFADLKKELCNVTRDQWESLPDAPSQGSWRQKAQFWTPTPDNVVSNAKPLNQLAAETNNFNDPKDKAINP